MVYCNTPIIVEDICIWIQDKGRFVVDCVVLQSKPWHVGCVDHQNIIVEIAFGWDQVAEVC